MPPVSAVVAISSSAGSSQLRAMLSIGRRSSRSGESSAFNGSIVMNEEGKPGGRFREGCYACVDMRTFTSEETQPAGFHFNKTTMAYIN